MIDIMYTIDNPLFEPVIRKAVQLTLTTLSKQGHITIQIVDTDTMIYYNSFYRQVNDVTDVLSFEETEEGELGVIVICLEKATAQAIAYDHSLERELAFLSIHGTLHLLGYDHEIMSEEEKMFSLQSSILEKMELFR